ncbi:hypothetical protein KR018_001035, partial [Drosophila ironensis]
KYLNSQSEKMFEPADPLPHWVFATPWPTFIIMSSYFIFVLKLGPKMMEGRRAFELRKVIQAYNIIQIIYNTGLFLYCTDFLFVQRVYDLRCWHNLPLDHSSKDAERLISNAYTINKFVDLIETLFMVLRKKDKQISFLHLFHHGAMATLPFFIIRFLGYGGFFFAFCYANTLVHVIMYTYYFASSVSKEVQKNIWWKKYITIIQLVQFLLGIGCFIITSINPQCKHPPATKAIIITMLIVFITLFSNFYYKSYIRKPAKEQSESPLNR